MELSTENSTESSPDRRNLHRASPLLLVLSDIKIAHSVFAMPFALLAAFLATPIFQAPKPASPQARFPLQLLLIVLCMVFARTWAMLINRIADRRIDRDNPRTERRVIASGRLSPFNATIIALATAACFILGGSAFHVLFRNPWPLVLSIPVLAWIALYSYTKRFTLLCHLFLGSALAASPIAAAIAINPDLFLPTAFSTPSSGTGLQPVSMSILLLSAFVLFWVAGFDIAYALQDIDFDRRAGLHSIPARLGPRGSLWVSRAFHTAAFAFLFFAARADPRFGPIFLAAVIAVGALLIYEHIVLARRGVAGLPIAFFTVNGVVSCLLGAAGIADILL